MHQRRQSNLDFIQGQPAKNVLIGLNQATRNEEFESHFQNCQPSKDRFGVYREIAV